MVLNVRQASLDQDGKIEFRQVVLAKGGLDSHCRNIGGQVAWSLVAGLAARRAASIFV